MKEEKILVSKVKLANIYNTVINGNFPSLTANQIATLVIEFKNIVETPAFEQNDENDENNAKSIKKD